MAASWLELQAYLGYTRRGPGDALSFWRSSQQHEVDFVVGDHTGIEVKATRKVVKEDARGLLALKEEGLVQRFLLVSQDPIETENDGVLHLHYKTFLTRLWQGEIF